MEIFAAYFLAVNLPAFHPVGGAEGQSWNFNLCLAEIVGRLHRQVHSKKSRRRRKESLTYPLRNRRQFETRHLVSCKEKSSSSVALKVR